MTADEFVPALNDAIKVAQRDGRARVRVRVEPHSLLRDIWGILKGTRSRGWVFYENTHTIKFPSGGRLSLEMRQ